MDHAYQWVIDNVALQGARVIGVFDRVVVNDAGVNGTGNTVVRAGTRLRYLTTGLMSNYGMAMVAGAVGLAVILWARS